MEPSPQLAQLIRERKGAILETWSEHARAHPVAAKLPQPYLQDSMPDLLDRMAATLERGEAGDTRSVEQESSKHAGQRLGFGYEIGQLVGEYIDLRRTLEEVLSDCVGQLDYASWQTLHTIIDDAISGAVARFARAREYKLRVFERVSGEPLEAANLDELLHHLLGVMGDVAAEVDAVSILLREGDALTMRASRGLEEENLIGTRVPIGQGFSGIVAATREPLLVRDAANDERMRGGPIRVKSVKALYGVPLVDQAGDLVGVAVMGSKKAHDFQEEDLILFRALANRATRLIESRRTTDRLLLDEHQRERFIAILGHDLRSPLASVIGSAQTLLVHGRLDERERRAAARILRASERMARLVGDLLDFTRARIGGGIPTNPVWTDLAEIVRGAVDEAEAAHPGRTVRLAATLRSRVCCDPDRLAQLVSNLVLNALDHGDPDAPVDVSVDEAGPDALVAVHNEGPPIPPELLPHVFDPFRRGGHELAPGVGLGLFIASAIAVAHDGHLDVRSEPGRGTTFSVRIPKEPPGPRGAPTAPPRSVCK